MAETPKGDTASRTDAPDADAPDADGSEPVRLSDAADAGPGSGPDGAIAGAVGQDSLATAGAPAEPWSANAAEPTDPAAPAASAAKSGGLRGTLILVILLALAIGGGYATYPMWRGEVEPYARQLGIALPAAPTAPETARPAESAVAAKPAEPKSAEPKPAEPKPADAGPTASQQPSVPATRPDPAPRPPSAVADPALAGDVDRLIDRVNALDQRIAALESPAPEPAKADAAALERLAARVDEMSQTLTAVNDEVAIVREGLAASGGGEGLGPMASQLSDRLQGLTDRMEALEKAAGAPPAEPAVTAEDIGGLQARLDALSGDVDSLSGKVEAQADRSAGDAASLSARLADLQGQLDRVARALENTRSGREKAGAFLLAANQLASAAAASGSFVPELQAVRAAAPGGDATATALDTLAGHADGVPSLAILRDRFARTAADAVDASVVGSGEGLIGQTLTRVASLVTVRRTATADGDGLDAMLVRAEAALASGDLAGAIQAVRRLDGDPGKAAAGWLADAEARAAVDAAVRTLQSQALAGVAGG